MIDRYLREDIEYLKTQDLFDELNNSIIFITGITGLLGSLLAKTLISLDKEIKVIGLARNKEKAEEVFSDFLNSSISIVVGDVTDKIQFDGSIDYIFHCASVTNSKTMVEMPVETIRTSVIGTDSILDFAVKKNVKSVIYISSMEMYGNCTGIKHDIGENDIGVIDHLKLRSNYPESKRLCENMCIAYHSEYGLKVKIARMAQTFGPGIMKNEKRVFAQFARSVIDQTNIILHTDGLSEGNYCYTRDAIEALLILLLRGCDGEAYNISNPESHTTIRGMAEMVAREIAKDKIKVIVEMDENNSYGYAEKTKMKLSADKMMQLGWTPKVGLKDSYKRLINSMIENNL